MKVRMRDIDSNEKFRSSRLGRGDRTVQRGFKDLVTGAGGTCRGMFEDYIQDPASKSSFGDIRLYNRILCYMILLDTTVLIYRWNLSMDGWEEHWAGFVMQMDMDMDLIWSNMTWHGMAWDGVHIRIFTTWHIMSYHMHGDALEYFVFTSSLSTTTIFSF